MNDDNAQQQLTLTAPIVRSSDPLSSFEAAEEVTQSGLRQHQAQRCLQGVERYPGKTSRELARLIDLDRYAVARRLPDLEHDGHIRKGTARPCEIGRRQAVTWWPITKEAA